MTFGEDNRVPNSGLIGPVLLAELPGVAELVGQPVRFARKASAANGDAKAPCLALSGD
jgi:hypothetical protein